MEKRLQSQIKACPDSKFVLSGYSQGGMVTISALSKLASYADKVVAVVLYGAGDGSGVNAAFKQKTIANCAPGDFVSKSKHFYPHLGMKIARDSLMLYADTFW
jgi:hypothetical protein